MPHDFAVVVDLDDPPGPRCADRTKGDERVAIAQSVGVANHWGGLVLPHDLADPVDLYDETVASVCDQSVAVREPVDVDWFETSTQRRLTIESLEFRIPQLLAGGR